MGFKALGQTTPNIGFENGNFDNWQCFTGSVDVTGNIIVAPSQASPGRIALIGPESTGLLDPYGLFPINCPNGSKYCVKLGDILNTADPSTTKKADRISYTFTAPSVGPYSIIFNYAVVLEDPPHLSYQQPAFTVYVYDVTDGDKLIECPAFDFVPGISLPGFKLSTAAGAKGNSIYYKDWSTAIIDLRAYPGKTIRLEFTANDCTLGGHFGYAYIDVQDDSSSKPITGNAYCLGQNSVTLYAPVGFSDYFWYTADMSKQLHHGASYTISPPPPNNTGYGLQILPYPDLGECVDTLYTVVNQINEGFKLAVKDTVLGCPDLGADLTAAAVTAGSSDGMTLSYYTDSLGTVYLYQPNAVKSAGTYYIRGINKEGCMNLLPVYVKLSLPSLDIIETRAVDYPITVDLSKTFVPQAGLTYSYYSDANGTLPLTNYTAIKYGGTYYIKAASSLGCSVIEPVIVTIHPPPPYTVTAPNTFTPNNDGVNDHFSLAITGKVAFIDLKIFNRNGQVIFDTKSEGDFWDGNYNNKNLPSGTYYWVFDGEDNYNNVKIKKSGPITLIR